MPARMTEQSPNPSCFANGKLLVMRIDATLPPRCIKCNCQTDIRIRKRLLWANTSTQRETGPLRFVPHLRHIYAFISLKKWIGDLSTLRSPVVTIPLCPRHWLTSKLMILIPWLCIAGAIAVFELRLSQLLDIWVLVLGVALAAIAWSRPRPVKAVYLDREVITVTGAGKSFLASIPILPGAPVVRAVEEIAQSTQLLKDRMAAKKGAKP